MAAADPAKNIKGEATCSICLDLFKDPVTTECGHSFCKQCITQHCKEKEFNIVCPLCRKRFRKSNLRPNREMKNIVVSIPELFSSERLRKPIEENVCERHGDPLKFYCKEDQTPVCMVCDRSQAHCGHTVVPVEEAVQEYWETITGQLEIIESTYGKLHLLVNKDWKHFPQSAGEEAHKRLKRLTENVAILLKVDIKSQRQRFEDLPSQPQPPDPDLKNFCPGKKIAVKTELQGHKERENIRDRVAEKQEMASHVIRICEEAPTPKYGLDHASLDPVIHNISNTTEDIHQKVDVKSLMRRFEDVTSLKPSVECGVRRKKSASSGGNVALKTTELWECKEKGRQVCEEQKEAATSVQKDAETPVLPRRTHSVPASGEHKLVDGKSHSKCLQDWRSVRAMMDSGGRRQDSISPGGNVVAQTELWGYEVDVTLDPATAHPRLILSEDRKSVRWGDTRQDLPNNPERFDVSVCALGSEGFTSGRHYWEVVVGAEGYWAIGVARDTVQRKGGILLQPDAGIWVLTSFEIPQFLPKEPRKIGVFLNYAKREVMFYNAENMALISSLTAKFKGRVVPFFRLWPVGSHITLSPCQR